MAHTLSIRSGGGLLLDGKGRLVMETDEVVASCIKLRNRFLFFRGDWFLDQREGVPYFQFVFIKNPNLGVIKQLFMAIIRSVPQFQQVNRVDVYLGTDRQLVLYFEATAEDGRLVTGGLGQPFTIDDETLF